MGLVPVADTDSLLAAERAGFVARDVRVTLGRTLTSAPAQPEGVRAMHAGDLPRLEALAQVSHRITRFYAEPSFSRAQSDALYAAWLRRSWESSEVAVWVVDDGAGAAGYLTCELASGQIGLVAVAPEARGRGAGRRLVEAGLRTLHEAGHARVTVVAQGANAPALRLYRGRGFAIERVEVWLHATL